MPDAKTRWVALVAALFLLSPGLVGGAERKRAQRSLARGTAVPPVPEREARDTSDPEVVAAIERLRQARSTAAESTSPTPAAGGEAAEERLFRTSGGHVRALVSSPQRPYRVSRPGADRTPRGLALSFLRENAVAFGASRSAIELRALAARHRGGRDVVRFEQRVAGLKVFGAGAVVQVEASGGVSFALSDLARDDSEIFDSGLSTLPAVEAGAAVEAARDVLPIDRQAPDLAPRAEPELMLFEPDVIGEAGPPALVWHVRLFSKPARVDEVVLVNAVTGSVAFHYSNVKEAKNRLVYDHGNDPFASPASPARSEGDPAVGGPPDVDLAYDYLGDTYDFYFSRFGRDSFDGSGAALVGRVRFCEPFAACPYDNAYWSGTEMVFGDGFASADDVVGHELTHAVTEREAGLIYWGESGAIDEAFADVFGELIDLTNSGGDDSPGVRWQIGEDLPIGAIRNMSDPSVFGDPDRRYSPNWYWGDGDNRGVHVNSGVANKLASLLVDGGTFNGQTVSALGIDAVAALFYEVQTSLLTPGSDYFDLFAALRQAALNLGWSTSDQQALDAACLAVEIAVPSDQQTVFFESFNGKVGRRWDIFDANPASGKATWGKSTFRKVDGKTSFYCAAGGTNPAKVGGPYRPNMEAWMVRGPFSLAEAEDAWVEFELYLDVEYPYDDVWWGVSIDDDWSDGQDWDGYFVSPAPDGLTPGWVHEVTSFKELEAYGPVVGAAKVWFAVVFDSDEIVQYEGAYVDSIRVTRAASPSVTLGSPNGGESWPLGSLQLLTWSGQGLRPTDQIRLSRVDGGVPTEIATLPYDQTSYWWSVSGSVTSTARLRVECVGCFPTAFDDSDTDLSITAAVTPPVPKADFDLDGKPDLLWRNGKTGALSVWYMDGLVRVGAAVPLAPDREVSKAWRVVGLGDFNGDGKTDLLWWHSKNGALGVWLMDGLTRIGDRMSLTPLKAGGIAWRVAAVADFNSDGKPDILWRNASTGILKVWYMDGLNRIGLEAATTPAKEKGLAWDVVGAGDFNRDGKPDLLWRNQNNGVLVLWLMDGLNRIGGRTALVPKKYAGFGFVGVDDFDLDGSPDLLFRNSTNGDLSVWFMDGFTRSGAPAPTAPPRLTPLSWAIVLR